MHNHGHADWDWVGQSLVGALAELGESAEVLDNGPYYKNKIRTSDNITIQYCLWEGGFAVEIDPRIEVDTVAPKWAKIAEGIIKYLNEIRTTREFEALCKATEDTAKALNKRFKLCKASPLHIIANGDKLHIYMSGAASPTQMVAMVKAARACGLLKKR